VKNVLQGTSADDLQKLTLSAFLADLMRNADVGTKKKLTSLVEKAKELGIQ
jgi:hypothetical protein